MTGKERKEVRAPDVCRCMHQAYPSTSYPSPSFSWPGAVYLSISSALWKQGPHPYSPASNSSAYLPPNPWKTSSCSSLHIHTYINTSLWRREANAPGQEGVGDKHHLEFKAEDWGSSVGRRTGSKAHGLKLTLAWHRQVDWGFIGSESRCVHLW